MLPILRRDITSTLDAVMREAENTIDRLFDDTFVFRSLGRSFPKVNVEETETSYIVEAAVPGFTKENVKIDVTENDNTKYLTLRAEKSENQKDGKFLQREIHYSSFHRSWVLPENVNTDNITATYKNGVLHLEIPKTAPTKVAPVKREIPIN